MGRGGGGVLKIPCRIYEVDSVGTYVKVVTTLSQPPINIQKMDLV